MLPLIGTSDQVDLLGYVIERCPACGTTGPLAVYETKKKITVYFIPTVPYQKNQMIECKTCHSRFLVPDDMRESLGKRLISQDALSEQIRQMRSGVGGSNGMGHGGIGRGPGPGGVGPGQKRRTRRPGRGAPRRPGQCRASRRSPRRPFPRIRSDRLPGWTCHAPLNDGLARLGIVSPYWNGDSTERPAAAWDGEIGLRLTNG